MKTLIITAEVTKKDKNNKDFKVLEISTPGTVYTRNAQGQMTAVKQKPETVGGVTGWLESNLPSLKGKPDFEATLSLAEEVAGTIVARKVVPYFIADRDDAKVKGTVTKEGKTGRMVDSSRVVVFGNTEDEEAFELAIAQAFKRKGHTLAIATAQQAVVIAETPVDTALLPAEKQAAAAN